MDPMNIDQLVEKLNILHQRVPQQSDHYLKFARASEKLQSALHQFKNNPSDSNKSKSLVNALDIYRTASEIFLIKMKSANLQTKDEKISLKNMPFTSELYGAMSDAKN